MGVFYLLGSTRYSSRSFYADSLGLNNNNNKLYWMTFTSCRGLTWDLGTGLSGGQKWNLSGPHDAPLITLSTELNFMHSESYQMSCDGIDVNVHLKHVICARITSAEAGPRPNAEALTVSLTRARIFLSVNFRIVLQRNQIGCVAVGDVSFLRNVLISKASHRFPYEVVEGVKLSLWVLRRTSYNKYREN